MIQMCYERGKNMDKILVIEDEERIRQLISYNLTQNSYEVEEASDGIIGLEMLKKTKPDLIVLDVMLPGLDGFEICRRAREDGIGVPIIMLTAKNLSKNVVEGLNLGADDYLSKPFSVHELLARIKAVMRRTYSKENTRAQIVQGGLVIDVERHEVILNGIQIELSLKEFNLLKKLAENKGIVMTREQLLDQIWGIDYDGENRTVDVHIRYLRKKLGDKETNGTYIQTIRGIGYRMP